MKEDLTKSEEWSKRFPPEYGEFGFSSILDKFSTTHSEIIDLLLDDKIPLPWRTQLWSTIGPQWIIVAQLQRIERQLAGLKFLTERGAGR